MGKPFIKRIVAGIGACVVALALASPAVAGTDNDADIAMRVRPGGAWIGESVLSTDGAGQTLTVKVPRGSSRLFDVCIANNLGTANQVNVASDGDQGRLRATWTDKGTDAVIPDGTIEAGYGRDVPIDQGLCLLLKIYVGNRAAPGVLRSWVIDGTAAGGATPDTAIIRIRVTK